MEDFQRNFENDGEQAAAARSSPSARLLLSSSLGTSGNPAPSVYNNLHRSSVRRSSDGREEDSFLEEDSPMDVDWRSDSQEQCLTQQPTSLEASNEMIVTSSNITSAIGQVTSHESLVEALGNLSIQYPYLSQQECGRHLSTQASFSKKGINLELPVEGFLGNANVNHDGCTLCVICLFKRGIIARDQQLEYALYIFPFDFMPKIFPKIIKNEALVHHGTEFPLGEEHQTMHKCLLHRQVVITGDLHVSFEMVDGQYFTISSPISTTVKLSEISAKSEHRITPGFSLKVLVTCTGGTDRLYEDQIRLMLHSGSAIPSLMFPIAYYKPSVSPWSCAGETVIPMPKEDREALRSCHVELLDNIGDVLSLCQHLYQCKIFDHDDLDEIRRITKEKERNAYVLRTLQTRGNVLDFVVKIMQTQRANQGAAAILQKIRCNAVAPI